MAGRNTIPAVLFSGDFPLGSQEFMPHLQHWQTVGTWPPQMPACAGSTHEVCRALPPPPVLGLETASGLEAGAPRDLPCFLPFAQKTLSCAAFLPTPNTLCAQLPWVHSCMWQSPWLSSSFPGATGTRLGLFLVTTWSPPGKPARGLLGTVGSRLVSSIGS